MPSQRRGINAWWIRLPILAITSLLLIVLALVVFYTAYLMHHQDRIYAGVSAMGVDLGGLTLEEATLALASHAEYQTNGIYTLRYDDRLWQVTSAELGVAFDLDATIAQAYAIGHQRDVLFNIFDQAGAWFGGRDVPPIITYDQNVAQTFLAEIATQIDRPAVDAVLTVDGLNVITQEGEVGRRVDVGATLAAIDAAIFNRLTTAEIPLVIHEISPAIWSVDEPAGRIRAALSAPVRLTATDESGQSIGTWTASVDQLASLLNVTLINNGDGTHSYDVSIHTSAFQNYLESLSLGLIRSPRDGRFRFNPATRQLEVTQPSVSGRTLNVSATLAQLENAIFDADNRTISLVFDSQLPRYHNQISAAELGITQLVSESTTYFTGSTLNRRHNIALSASKFDGIIIAPGEEFSFNYFLGELSEAAGYRDGNIIFGGRTILGIGGGVCQVSTTIFRAAFSGGYAITERNSHGYRVGYYEQRNQPPGLDAAIWVPDRDFRFQNNTPYHLMIAIGYYPNEDALQFRIYSTPHWRAEIQDPIIRNVTDALPTRFEANRDLQMGQELQVDYAAQGADVTVYRRIYDMEGNFVREDYTFTHYLPWGAIIQVAPGDSRLSSAS